jgi:predicted AAA+ superfamily ATPase
MNKRRYVSDLIEEFCFSGSPKMAFIVGPRQCGKTTLSKGMLAKRGVGAYYNWDQREFRAVWTKSPNSVVSKLPQGGSSTPMLVLDEIHKAKLWKRTLKGIFDTTEKRVDIVVTGSARLDIFKKGSDSLLGRYFLFHLHPFSVAELTNQELPDPDQALTRMRLNDPASKESFDSLQRLLKFGGFPEPLFSNSPRKAKAWQQLRNQQIVREDLRDLSKLPELSQIEMLVALLPERAAQPLSRAALREDLEVAHTTVTRWLSYLASLFYHFEVKPFSHRIKQSIKKEGKLYLWDCSEVPEDGPRFENLVANHLLKACNFWTDSGSGKFELSYVRNFSGEEIDFLVTKDRKPWAAFEVKLSDKALSPSWNKILPQLGAIPGFQLVNDSSPYFSSTRIGQSEVVVRDAASALRCLV